MPAGKTEFKTREQKERDVIAIANRERNSRDKSTGRVQEVPEDKKALVAAIPRLTNEIRKHGQSNIKVYGLGGVIKFTREELQDEIEQLFDFCSETGLPVNMAMLGSWLGVVRDTLAAWMRDPTNPLSDIVKAAKQDMESIRIINGELNATNPIFSMFILKAMHGYVETSAVQLKSEQFQQAEENITLEDIERQVGRIIESTDI